MDVYDGDRAMKDRGGLGFEGSSTRRSELAIAEGILRVDLPQAYVSWVAERTRSTIRGYKIFGLPRRKLKEDDLSFKENLGRQSEKLRRKRIGKVSEDKVDTSVIEATMALRQMRPDLPEDLVAIAFHEDRALCLDLREQPEGDAPLVEVSLTGESPIWEHNKTFSEWLEEGKREDQRFKAAVRRIRNRQNEVKLNVVRRIIEKEFGAKCPICETNRRTRRHLMCSDCYHGRYCEEAGHLLAFHGKILEELEWMEEKLEERGIVVPRFWSQVSTYCQCPAKWWLSRRYRPEFRPSALKFGKAIHETLATFYLARGQGRVLGLHDLLTFYQEAWKDSQKAELRFSKGEDERTLYQMAERMLRAFLEAVTPGEILAVEQSFAVEIVEGLLVSGIVDLVEVKESRYWIVDFKTSRGEPSAAFDAEQVALYQLGLGELGIVPEDGKVGLRYDVLRKLKTRGQFVQVEVSVSQKDLSDLKEKLLRIRQAMDAGILYRVQNWTCQTCPWAYVCREVELSREP